MTGRTHASNRLAALNAEIDQALDERVRLHAARRQRAISASEYLAGLRAVRDVEDRIEPQRRDLGALTSRAYELSMGGDV